MQSFSPFTRRLLALGILILLLLLGINLASAMLASVGGSLDVLADARFRSARLNALAQRPPMPMGAPVDPALLVGAPSRAAAEAQVARTIAAAARREQLPLERLAPLPADPADPKQIRASIRAIGPEPAMLTFLSRLEQGRPAIRLAAWRIATADAGVRFEGTALAAWKGAR